MNYKEDEIVNSLPWVEKYRPKKLCEVEGNENIIRTLGNYGGISRIPNLLFYGPPGTGKTSTILAMAKEYYGNSFKSMTLELNASDERGIETVRETIKTFCNNSSFFSERKKDVKLIILDEADALTVDAQSALRRVIETSTKHVRFCICCNYVNKITPALQSRCTKLKFKGISKESLKKTAMIIIEKESMDIEETAVDAIIDISRGDARRVINLLQTLFMSYNRICKISEEKVYFCVAKPNPNEIDIMLRLLIKEDFQSSFNIINNMLKEKGYSLSEIVSLLCEKVLYESDICGKRLGILLDQFSNIEYNLSEGGSERLQLGALVGAFHLNNQIGYP